MYSYPLTRSYARIFYNYAHVIDFTDVDTNGGKGDQQDRPMMYIEGAYDHAISINGHRLCLVDMSRIKFREDFYDPWESDYLGDRYFLYLSGPTYEKHKPLMSNEAVRLVKDILSWWASNPERPVLKSFDKDRFTATCPSLYLLYCIIDEDI
ncbi:hypothetical protein GOP47_0005810 [Adiantum capillus-veneris]|uniref:Uncharacterized protein n=1 Tax=Adiantum capillus-veneris TaxID=13818 RepID=A0A9D4V6R8_ADICA|nr:hypothetical protein GOP47_0005810 [Adiantum capillus-veneris]